jgi:hypothetical protein
LQLYYFRSIIFWNVGIVLVLSSVRVLQIFSYRSGAILFETSVADPGSGALLTPGSGMGKKSGSGIRICDDNPDHISES